MLCLTLCLSLITLAHADTIVTTDNFNLNFSNGQSFNIQDLAHAVTFTFTVSAGSLVGTGSLSTLDTGGTLTVTPSTTGNLMVTASNNNYILYFNNVQATSNILGFTGTHTFTISWSYPQTYSITVNSVYGNPTSSGTVAQGSNYATSVTSPYSLGIGIQAVCLGYSIDGGGVTAGTSYTFTNILANHTITYSWQTQYLITPSADSNSAITPSTTTWVNSGDSQTFNYSATTPYSITGVYVDSNPTPITGAYTFTNVQAPHTIQVFSSTTIPPTFSAITTSSTVAGVSSTFTVTVNDAVALEPLGTYQFGTNNTGAWIWYYPPFTFVSTPQTVSTTITLNDTVGVVVACEYNFTNNAGIPANTGIQAFTTTFPAPTPTPGILPATLNVAPFWNFLFSGNFLGFFSAIYLSAFGLEDIFIGALCLVFLIPIYLKTRSLWLNCVLWILLGSFIIALAPAASVFAILLLIFGFGSILWKLVRPT